MYSHLKPLNELWFPLHFLTIGLFVLLFFFGIAYWTSWQPEGQGSHVAVATALQAALSPVLLVAQMHLSCFVSWKTGEMIHIQVAD